MNNSKLVVTFVSGKGGVGKTMLAVAFASELARQNRVLLLDLDFFNRGLTGLMGTGKWICEISKPKFLDAENADSSEQWSIIEVSPGLFHLQYPDLSPADIHSLETSDVTSQREPLGEFISQAAEACDCQFVVLDCHGGPDSTSFAACLLSDYSLLVSEPDRITFYGTLNFIRQIERLGVEKDYDLRLVFNKVIPGFSAFFLNSFYDKNLKSYFSNRPLLAIFPLEVYLTKEFEKTPFLSNAYPNSLLSRKSRTMIYDLLCPKYKNKLPPSIRSMPKWMRIYRKFSLGSGIPLLKINFIMAAIVTVTLMLSISYLLTLNGYFAMQREQVKLEMVRLKILGAFRNLSLLDEDTRQLIFSDVPSVNALRIAMEKDSRRYFNLMEAKKLLEYANHRQFLPQYYSEYYYDYVGFGYDFYWRDDIEDYLDEKMREVTRRFYSYQSYSKYRSQQTETEVLMKSLTFLNKADRDGAIMDLLGRIDGGIISERYDDPSIATVLQLRARLVNKPAPEGMPDEYKKLYDDIQLKLRDTSTLFIIPEKIRESGPSIYPLFYLVGLFWVAASFLLSWTRDLDRLFTYSSRRHKWAAMLIYMLLAFGLWFGPALVMGILGADPTARHPQDWQNRAYLLIFAGSAIIFFAVFLEQSLRVYRDARYERHIVEDVARILFLSYVVAVAYFVYRFNIL